MKKLRTIIVDDENLAIDLLRSYLDDMPEIDIVAECSNGKEAIKAAMEFSPDLLFLDIQMPGLNGFDVVARLQSDIMPLIVFVTAYDQYAIDAFDVHAVDYILKPMDGERIKRAVQRCFDRMHSIEQDGSSKHRILGAMDEISKQVPETVPAVSEIQKSAPNPNEEKQIVVKDRDSITFINQVDIVWIDAAGDYMCIHVGADIHILRSTMKCLLEQLNPEIFKRVHRSTIVNLKRIERVFPHTKGEYFLQLGKHARVKVSRNYRAVIKTLLRDA